MDFNYCISLYSSYNNLFIQLWFEQQTLHTPHTVWYAYVLLFFYSQHYLFSENAAVFLTQAVAYSLRQTARQTAVTVYFHSSTAAWLGWNRMLWQHAMSHAGRVTVEHDSWTRFGYLAFILLSKGNRQYPLTSKSSGYCFCRAVQPAGWWSDGWSDGTRPHRSYTASRQRTRNVCARPIRNNPRFQDLVDHTNQLHLAPRRSVRRQTSGRCRTSVRGRPLTLVRHRPGVFAWAVFQATCRAAPLPEIQRGCSINLMKWQFASEESGHRCFARHEIAMHSDALHRAICFLEQKNVSSVW